MSTLNRSLSIRSRFQPPAPASDWESQASFFIDKLPKLRENDTSRLILIGAILNLCEASHYQRRQPHNGAIRHKSLDIANGVLWSLDTYLSHLPHSTSWLKIELEHLVRKAIRQMRSNSQGNESP